MPTTLSTTVRHIYDRVPNSVNSQLIADFHQYMKDSGTSQRHQNNNLKAIIAFAEFLGPDTTYHQVITRDQITRFLDTKIKDNSEDPERRWITTWNDYLVRIKHFFSWLHNNRVMTEGESEKEDQSLSSSSIDWKTPSFVNIKSRELRLFRVLNWEEYKGKIALARIITDPF